MIIPPVKLTACPVMYEASSESRNQIPAAHSSDEAGRPSGILAFRSLLSSSTVEPRSTATAARSVSCMGVSIRPGQMALTRTPAGANAYAKDRVRLRTADFEAAYAATSSVVANLADPELTFTIAPPLGISRPI